MSLVGPRPEWVALVPEFQGEGAALTPPAGGQAGLNGLGSGQEPVRRDVGNTGTSWNNDLYYIKNMSIFLDMLILLHTVQIVLFTRGSGEWNKKQAPSTYVRLLRR